MKTKVLIVDNEEYVAKSLKLEFEDRGYDVTITTSIEEVKGKYAKEEFDFAVIDGLNGRYKEVHDMLERTKRRIIFSGDDDIVKEAKQKRLESYVRLKEDDKFWEIFKNEN